MTYNKLGRVEVNEWKRDSLRNSHFRFIRYRGQTRVSSFFDTYKIETIDKSIFWVGIKTINTFWVSRNLLVDTVQ